MNQFDQFTLRTWAAAKRWVNMSGQYEIHDRSRGQRHLLIVLAGYTPELWDITLPRIKRFAPPTVDVCIVTPGVYRQKLVQMAEENGWSYLWSKANHIALPQNSAILAHPQAEWIFKIDEDVFITERYFEDLVKGYERVEAEGRYAIGFVAPMLNVNGYSYIPFLERVGLAEKYRERFGELRHATTGVMAREDPGAARFLWEASLPMEQVAAEIRDQGFGYSTIPHTFSIGAILLKREFWEQMGGFARSAWAGRMAVEEKMLCRYCVARSRVMICLHNVFAGHLAFAPQRREMLTMLEEMRGSLMEACGK